MSDTQKELEHYKKLFSVGEEDLAVKGYLAFVKLVKQQIEYVDQFNIKSNIDGKKTETVLYDRAIALGEGLPDMISKMNRLKYELNIPFDPDAGKPKAGAISPQNIGKSL